MKLTVVIPAYNEEKNIGKVLDGVKKYTKDIVVVDDCSRDNTKKIAQEKGAKVYRHIINRGLGGALDTGIKAAIIDKFDIIITLDADGQHDPDEIPKLILPIINKEADFVVGSRFLEKQNMPPFRVFANIFGNFITFLFWGVKASDTQSGMRAFSLEAAKKIKILTRGMEASSEIIKEVKENNLKLKEVPIKAIYTEYSLSKGQGLAMGFKTLFKLLILKLTQ